MAIELLLLGKSISATARAIEIDRKTLYNRRQEDLFREVLEDRRRELWSDASGRLAALVHPSLDAMEQHLADRHDRARFRATSAVLRLVSQAQGSRERAVPRASRPWNYSPQKDTGKMPVLQKRSTARIDSP